MSKIVDSLKSQWEPGSVSSTGHFMVGADLIEAGKSAAVIPVELKKSSSRSTANIRTIRRKHSRRLRSESADLVLALARELCKADTYRWFGYELIQNHPGAFERLGEKELERFGQGLNSWWTIDAFARILSGPAWLKRQIHDNLIVKWARSKDRWWRRAALVSTVALNVRSQGGEGDVPRTLRVCRLLAGDRPKAVQRFLDEHASVLPSLVKREVKHKLKTGLKNPRRQR